MNLRELALKNLQRKTLGNPLVGKEPPNLSALMDRTSWAIEHPNHWNEKYLDYLKEDLEVAKACLDAIAAGIELLEKE